MFTNCARAVAFFWPTLSSVSWPLLAGTPLYAQVDSFNLETAYGAVLEGHESDGGVYDNVSGPVFVIPD